MRLVPSPHSTTVPQSGVFGDHIQNIFTFSQLIALSKSRDKLEDSPLRLQARHRVSQLVYALFRLTSVCIGHLRDSV